MKPDYIQLPPMPSDMPIELLEIIWGFARMEGTEKEKFLEFIRNVLERDSEDGRSERLIRMMEEAALEPSPYVEEFNSLMRELIGTLVAQACEMAALVRQYYCVEEKSIKEISETFHVPEDTIELMAQYYGRKMK